MYKYNEKVFLSQDNVSYYLLGCYLTDGCIYNNCFELTSKDKDWLDNLSKLICPDSNLSKHNNCWRLRGCNKNIVNWLKQNNCIPNKSLIVRFPNIPNTYVPDLIRGLIDGDGSISTTRNTVALCSASKLFIDQFIIILQQNNIKYHLYKRKKEYTSIRGENIKRKNPLYKVSICGKNCYKFLKWIYYSNDVLCMPRKYKLALMIINSFEERGLTIKNMVDFSLRSNENNPRCKLSNKDVNAILMTWNSLSQQYKNQKGVRKIFYSEYILNKYDITYEHTNRILNHKNRVTYNREGLD